MPLASLLLAAVTAAVAAPAPAAAPASTSALAAVAVSTRPYGLADLIAEVQLKGETAVLTNPLAAQIGVDDPTTAKVLHYPLGSDELLRSVYVAQKAPAFQTGTGTGPMFAILVTERWWPRSVERRYMRLAPDGRLEQATLITDKLDADGALKPGGRTVESISVKKAQEWLDHESDFYFHGMYRKQKEAP